MKLFPATNILLAATIGAFALYARFFAPAHGNSGYHAGALHLAARGVGIAVPGFWITAAATVVVGYLVLITAALTTATFLFDMVLLPFGQRLTVTAAMWDLVWNQIVVGTYWSPRNEAGVVAGIVILLAIAFVASQTR